MVLLIFYKNIFFMFKFRVMPVEGNASSFSILLIFYKNIFSIFKFRVILVEGNAT
jgi:hypothetical protein